MYYSTKMRTDFGLLRLFADEEALVGADLDWNDDGNAGFRELLESEARADLRESAAPAAKKKKDIYESAVSGAAALSLEEAERLAPLRAALSWYRAYFEGEQPDPSAVPLKLLGSPFRQEVWNVVREIPYGQVLSYGEIARLIAARRGIPKMAAQAVGGAVGQNHISILVPCHRVVGADGGMVGYGCAPGAIAQKRALLRHEGIIWAG